MRVWSGSASTALVEYRALAALLFRNAPHCRKPPRYAEYARWCGRGGSQKLLLPDCARHGVDVGGGSPLQALMTGTDSGRQLRRREAGWGGSWKQSSELTNRNRIPGRCGGVTRPRTGNPKSQSDTRIGKSGGDRAKDQRLTLGDLFLSPAIRVGRRQRGPMDGEKSAEAIVVRATG